MIDNRDVQHLEMLSREDARRIVGGRSRPADGPVPCFVGYESPQPQGVPVALGNLLGGSIGDNTWPGHDME